MKCFNCKSDIPDGSLNCSVCGFQQNNVSFNDFISNNNLSDKQQNRITKILGCLPFISVFFIIVFIVSFILGNADISGEISYEEYIKIYENDVEFKVANIDYVVNKDTNEELTHEDLDKYYDYLIDNGYIRGSSGIANGIPIKTLYSVCNSQNKELGITLWYGSFNDIKVTYNIYSCN